MTLRPWETSQGLAPWQSGQNSYPRSITIARPATSNDLGIPVLGNQGYIGEGASADSTGAGGYNTIASGVPCSIQARAMGKATASGTLPDDSPGPTVWKIFIPASAMAKGAARDRDIVTDDENYRYQVASAYWNALGFTLLCIRIEN